MGYLTESLTFTNFMEALKYLLDNCFFELGNKAFK